VCVVFFEVSHLLVGPPSLYQPAVNNKTKDSVDAAQRAQCGYFIIWGRNRSFPIEKSIKNKKVVDHMEMKPKIRNL